MQIVCPITDNGCKKFLICNMKGVMIKMIFQFFSFSFKLSKLIGDCHFLQTGSIEISLFFTLIHYTVQTKILPFIVQLKELLMEQFKNLNLLV